MARIVILGAGISGHTAARYLGKWVGKQHQVSVVSPQSKWNWIPSNVWVGVGQMTEKQVTFELAPIYKQNQRRLPPGEGRRSTRRAAARMQRPRDDRVHRPGPRRRDGAHHLRLPDQRHRPKLNFGATPGLGPDGGYTTSVCTPDMRCRPTSNCRPPSRP
jgi:sulfide:quinone oxidoreductase